MSAKYQILLLPITEIPPFGSLKFPRPVELPEGGGRSLAHGHRRHLRSARTWIQLVGVTGPRFVIQVV